MPFLPVSSGPYNLAEYLAAPVPWVTASTVPPGGTNRHDFPYVTQNINISNVGVTGSLFVGFTQAGLAGPNYITLQPSQSVSLKYRASSLFLRSSGPADYEIFAGLTGIKPRDLPPLTSSIGGSADVDAIASIPNMSAWWDAADLSTLYQDSIFTIPVTGMSQPVGGWLDKSGNGRNLIQPTSALRPTYFVDPYYPPAVLGNAVTKSWMSSSATIPIGGGAFTIFSVAKMQYLLDAIQRGVFRISATQNGSSVEELLYNIQSGTGDSFIGNSIVNRYIQSTNASSKTPSNKTFVSTVRSETGGSFPTLRINSVLVVTSSLNTFNTPSSNYFWLNSGYAGANGNDQYHEFIIFNRRLTDTEVSTVESYLMGKWVNRSTPIFIPSCSLWCDSYPGFGMHTSSTLLTSSKNPGDPVYDWIDGSGFIAGTHNRFVQTTTSKQPVITLSGSGGRRMVASDGVDDAMIGPTLSSINPSSDFTFLFMVDPPVFPAGTNGDTPGSYNNPFYISENNSNFGLYETSLPTNRLQFNVYTTAGSTIGLTASINTPYVVTCRYISSSRMMYMSLNGLGETTLQNGGVGNISLRGVLNLFGKAGLRWLQCRLGEIICYNRSLNPDELALVISYMKSKWGVPLSYVWSK